MKILVGADPELFLFNSGGMPISAYGLVPGDKKKPCLVDDGAIQVDGMALEFNITPAEDEEAFVKNLNSVMNRLKKEVPGNTSILITPVAEFGADYISKQPEAATRLGCDPDFDAWNDGCVNRPPNAELPFRTAAGHVHIGWTDVENPLDYDHMQACCNVIKQMDFFLGLPSLLFDKDVKRRTMYGRPGCFRPKSYGAEYRVLSNQWLVNDALKRWVFKNVQAGMDRYDKGDFVFYKVNKKIVDMMVNPNPDLTRVKFLLDKLEIEPPPVAEMKRAA